MRESATVNEWRAEAQMETLRASVGRLFELRFRQQPPARLLEALNQQEDPDALSRWLDAVATTASGQEFLTQVGL